MYKPKEVLSRISKAKNDLVTPTPYMQGAGGYRDDDNKHKKPEIHRIYALYCQTCRQAGVMDFDDILLYMNVLFKRSWKFTAIFSVIITAFIYFLFVRGFSVMFKV